MILGRGNGRKIIIHYHVFKNAGTSVDRFLAEVFGSSWIQFDQGTDPIAPSAATELLNDRPEVQALSSHLLRPPAPDGFSVFPIALIRHPLDRAYSCYSHSRRADPVFESMHVARRSNFAEYVSWCLKNPDMGGMVIVNYQTIHFSSSSFRWGDVLKAVASEADFEEAWAFIRSLPVAGVVDEFEIYFAKLRSRLSEFLGRGVEAKAARENVSPERLSLPLPQTVSKLHSLLDPGLLNQFLERNAWDYKLYEYTAKLACAEFIRPVDVELYDF